MKTASTMNCLLCNKAGAKFCNGCKNVRYCSKECQTKDRSDHKLLCAQYGSFDFTSRPSSSHVLAILFPDSESKPKLVWVHQRKDWGGEDGGKYAATSMKGLIGSDCGFEFHPIPRNKIMKQELEHGLQLMTRDSFTYDGSIPNESYGALADTRRGYMHYNFCGPMLGYRSNGWSQGAPPAYDVDLYDFRHIVDYLLWYESKPVPWNMVKGVRINCEGDQKVCGRPAFEAGEIPSTHPIFTHHQTSDIADRIGMPILTCRIQRDPKWADDLRMRDNANAAFLHQSLDLNQKRDPTKGQFGWGWISGEWRHSATSALVVRKDKKPLGVWDMEVLSTWCRTDIVEMISHAMGVYSNPPMSKEKVMSFICREIYEIRHDRLLEEKRRSGQGLGDGRFYWPGGRDESADSGTDEDKSTGSDADEADPDEAGQNEADLPDCQQM